VIFHRIDLLPEIEWFLMESLKGIKKKLKIIQVFVAAIYGI